MVLPESGTLIGHVNLQLVSRTHLAGEIGFVLLERPGEPRVGVNVDPGALRAAVDELRE